MESILFDRVAWQTILETERHVFQLLQPGTAIGLLTKRVFERQDGAMMVWVRDSAGMIVEYHRFSGFQAVGVDILLVAEEGSLRQMTDHAGDRPLAVMKEQMCQGNILFYAIKSQSNLEDLGLDDFIDSIGIPFLGACR